MSATATAPEVTRTKLTREQLRQFGPKYALAFIRQPSLSLVPNHWETPFGASFWPMALRRGTTSTMPTSSRAALQHWLQALQSLISRMNSLGCLVGILLSCTCRSPTSRLKASGRRSDRVCVMRGYSPPTLMAPLICQPSAPGLQRMSSARRWPHLSWRNCYPLLAYRTTVPVGSARHHHPRCESIGLKADVHVRN
jgi:hypothetical protein